MNVTIKINMDNAAFQERNDPGIELRRILSLLVTQTTLKYWWRNGDKITLRDINGNSVGTFEVTKED